MNKEIEAMFLARCREISAEVDRQNEQIAAMHSEVKRLLVTLRAADPNPFPTIRLFRRPRNAA